MKITWNPTTLLAPVPVVMATVGTMDEANIITIAWTGIINSSPSMTYISVRPERHSFGILEKTKEFTINLVPTKLARSCDFCGVRSGRDLDKFKECRLTMEPGVNTSTPQIAECPISVECKVVKVVELGSHHMFMAEIVGVNVDGRFIDKSGKLDVAKADLLCYGHGEYYAVGDKLGKFGFSVKKDAPPPYVYGGDSNQKKANAKAKMLANKPTSSTQNVVDDKEDNASVQNSKKSARMPKGGYSVKSSSLPPSATMGEGDGKRKPGAKPRGRVVKGTDKGFNGNGQPRSKRGGKAKDYFNK